MYSSLQLTFQTCLLFYILIGQSCCSVTSTEADDTSYLTRKRWVDTAFLYIKSLNCNTIFFTSQSECNHLLTVDKKDVTVYVAQNTLDSRHFISALPDGGLSRAGAHHGVVALDPHPQANFGHLVVVFFIDRTDRRGCERAEGVYMGSNECLKLALKRRCENALHRRWRRQDLNNVSERLVRKMVRKCEINFIPHVRLQTSSQSEDMADRKRDAEQHLTCSGDLVDYSPCPTLRPSNETIELVCNPMRDNTRRCETSHEAVGTRCRMFESCDQAVLISGGWNRQTSLSRHSNNVVNMYHLLRRNGFNQQGIKVFFANGMHRGIQEESGQDSINTEILPAAMKTSMRLHLQKLCSTPHCVDTLVIYLNSPSKTDGTMLLWDMDKNGKADSSETYSLDELLSDTANCKANSVQIIADQSFSGELSRAMRKSREHPNVVAFVSSSEHEYSYMSTFTDFWVAHDHSHTCTQTVFQNIKSAMKQSSPEMGTRMSRRTDGPGPVTLFGAPCNVNPPFNANELRLYYRGCQNVPTEVWLRTFFATTNSDSQRRGQNSQISALLSNAGQPSRHPTHNLGSLLARDNSHTLSSSNLDTHPSS